MAKRQKKEKEKPGCYLVTMFASLILVCIWKTIDHVWDTKLIPFGMFEFWKFDLSLIKQGMYVSCLVFGWGIGLKIIHLYFSENDPILMRLIDPEENLARGVATSIFAGVMEEIAFRWLIFFSAIVAAKISNWLFLGFLGWNIIAWLYLHIAGPIANLLTLGLLKPIIFHPYGWFVGSAMLSTNVAFRDGHKYLGFIGFINSWLVGFFLFYIVFNYGLVTAILAHAIYDLLLDGISYIYLKFIFSPKPLGKS